MSYSITLTNGTVLATIPDGTINTNAASTLTLVGKNYAGYGQFLDNNFARSLENSAYGTAPGSPLVGQLWWDSTNKVMKVYPLSGGSWKSVGAATSSTTAPAANVSGTGDLWFDTVNQQLKVYNGNAYGLVGPAYSSGQGITGGYANTITDTGGNTHTILEMYSGNTVIATFSADPQYSPNPAIPGFSNVYPGLTLANSVTNSSNVTSSGNVYLYGTATNALSLGGLPASAYVSSGGNGTANLSLNTANITSANISNLVVTGNSTLANTRILSLGVGIAATGTTGEIVATNNITAYYSSDIKFKANVQPIQAALSKVDCIGGKTFEWTDEYLSQYGGEDNYFHPKNDFGVIAQDVQQVFPTAVRTREDGSLAVDYTKLVALSFEAIKELSARVSALEAKLQ